MKHLGKKIFAMFLVLIMLTGVLPVTALASGTTEIVGQQLVLEDDLSMNFVVAVDEAHKATAVINVGTESYPVSALTADADGNYAVKAQLAAAQMTDAITVSVVDGDETLVQNTYSIRDYCIYLIEGDFSTATKELARQVLDYGTKAQTYFGYNTESLANAGYELKTVTQLPANVQDSLVNGNVSGISFYGASLLFKNKIALRYYFKVTGDVNNYTFKVGETSYSPVAKDGMYYVDVAGINPQEYTDAVTLTVANETKSMTVDYSPMAYITRMAAKETTSDNLKALLSALYGYHVEAQEYLTGYASQIEANGTLDICLPDYLAGFVVGDQVRITVQAQQAEPFQAMLSVTTEDGVAELFLDGSKANADGIYEAEIQWIGKATDEVAVLKALSGALNVKEIIVQRGSLPVYEDADKTVSIQPYGYNVTFDQDGEKITYSAGSSISAEQRSIVVKLLDTSKEVIKLNFKFTGNTDPSLAVYCGTSTARFVITDAEGMLASILETGKEYTLWITANGQTEFTLYPMKFASDVAVDMELTVPETADVTTGSITAHAPNGNQAWMGLYQNGDQWQYGYVSDTSIHGSNTADNRRMVLTINEECDVVTFRFMLEASTANGAAKTNWKSYPSVGMQFINANGETVEATALQIGVWYTAVLTNSDSALPTSVTFYPLGYDDGSASNPIHVSMQIKDFVCGIPTYENADSTASVNSSDATVTFRNEGEKIVYSATSSHSAEQRGIAVNLLDSSKEVVKMNFKFTGNTTPTLNVYAGSKPGAYVITDAEGKLVSELETGKDYTLWITANGQTSFTVYPVKFSSGVSATMELSVPETFDVESAGITLTPNAGNYACVGLYQVGNVWQYGYVSDSAIHGSNTADARHFDVNVSGTYTRVSFQMMLEESSANGVAETNWKTYPTVGTQFVDANGSVVDATALQTNVWYTVIFTNSGNALPTVFDCYPLGWTNGSASSPVKVNLQIKNIICGEPVYKDADETVSINTTDKNVIFVNNGEKIVYSAVSSFSAEQRSIAVNLLDSSKDVVKMNFKFTGNTTPTLIVYTGSKPSAYVITDAEGKLVSELETGKDYTLWITANGQTSFTIYPVKFDSGVSATMELSVPETFDVEAAGMTLTPNAGNYACVGLYQVGNVWQYGYVSDSAIHGSNTADARHFDVNVSGTYTMASFQMMLEESTANGVAETNWKTYPTVGTQFVDATGSIVDATALQTNVWYTVILTNSGNALPATFDCYPLGWTNGSASSPVKVNLQIKNIICGEPVYKDADETVSINTTDKNVIFANNGENIVYSSASSFSAEQRSIAVNLLDSSKEVVKMNFKFTGNTTPTLIVYTGSKPSAYVITDAEGKLVSELETGKDYTLWITANGQTSFTIYPVKFDSGVSATMELSVPETFDVEDTGMTLTPNAGNYACVGLYQVGNVWQYGYVSDSAIHGSNTADARHFDVNVSGTYTVASFQMMLEESTANGVAETNWKTYPTVGTQFVDANGSVVDATALQTNVWYTVILTNSGNALPATFDCYPLGWTNGSASSPVKVSLQIKNIVCGIPTYESTDGTASIQAASKFVTFENDGEKIIYEAGNAVNPDNRAIKVTLQDTTKEVVKMGFKFTSGTSPVLYVSDVANASGIFGANYLVTDADGKLATALEAGKEYTLWITTEGQSEFTLYPMKYESGVAIAMEFTLPETFDVEAGSVTLGTASGNDASVGLYQNDGQWLYGYVSDSVVYTSNTAWNRRLILNLDSAEYKSVSFMFCLETSTFEGETVTNLVSEVSMEIYEGDALVNANELQTGVWYKAVLKNTDGSNLAASQTLYPLGFKDADLDIRMVLKDFFPRKATVAYTRGTPVAFATTQFRNVGADEMPISGFIGPQVSYTDYDGSSLPSLINDQSFFLLQEAGINLIMDQRVDYTGKTVIAQSILEKAEKYGISYFLPVKSVFDISNAADLSYGNVEEVTAAMEELYAYDSFAGFYFRDEPTSDMFPGITSAMNVFEQARAQLGYDDLQVYLNMFPKLAADRLSNNTDITMYWEKYVDQFSQTGVDYLMFDSYPFVDDTDDVQVGYMNMLGTITEQAKNDGKAWMGYVQTGGKAAFSENHSLVTQGQMNWNVYCMLAFGAKGISYYPLVTPPEMANYGQDSYNQDSLLNIYGEKTPFYNYAQKINTNIQAMDHILMNAAHEGIMLLNMESSRTYTSTDVLESYRCLTGVTTVGSVTIGCFDYEGTVALLVVNNSVTDSTDIALDFDNTYTYEVIQNTVRSEIDGSNVSLQLGAGECALIVVQ